MCWRLTVLCQPLCWEGIIGTHMSSKKAKKKIWVASFLQAVASSSPETAFRIADEAVNYFTQREKEGFRISAKPLPLSVDGKPKAWQPVNYEDFRHKVPEDVDPEHWSNYINGCIASQKRILSAHSQSF